MNSEFNILRNLLKRNRYDIEDDLLEIQFLSHPNKSSLRSITDTLDHFSIENVAAEISVKNLEEIDNPFIAHLKTLKDEQFVLAHSFTKDSIMIFDGKNEYKLRITDFLELWQRVVVVIGENEKRRIAFTSNDMILILLAVVLSIPFIMMEPIVSIIYYTLSTIGTLLSIFILQKELGYKNNLVKKLCGAQEKSGCDEVIKKTMKLPFALSFADFSFVYFVLLIFSSLIGNFGLIKILAMATIPVVLLSLVYQALVIKKWCVLCLGIIGVLIIQTLIIFFLSSIRIDIDTQLVRSIILYALSFLVFVTVWRALKNELAKTAGIKELRIENLKFRRDYALFLTNYNTQKKVDTSLPYQTPEITIGNPDAAIELLMISNPMCAPCAQAHLFIVIY